MHVSVQSTFSLASNVTFYDVVSSVKSYIRACKSPTEACQFISSLKPLHRGKMASGGTVMGREKHVLFGFFYNREKEKDFWHLEKPF